ncbi:MAG: magnesium transporter CorA family protein [Acidimicrobiales bacterium]
MTTTVIDNQNQNDHEPTVDELTERMSSDKFVWIDVSNATDADRLLLSKGLGLSDDQISNALSMRQRPRIIDLDEKLAIIIVYGLSGSESSDPVELHVLISEKFVVTIHNGALECLDQVCHRHRQQTYQAPQTPLSVLHQVVESLADGYFPRLSALDDEIDDIEDGIFKNPTDEQLQQLFLMKRELIGMRRVVAPMRDMLGAVFTGVVELPGFTEDTSGWLRDAYDHTIRISDLIDGYRDLLAGAMDVYLSTVSNRLNAVMKQLTVIATIFLPLSFLTGFFGQNFAFLVNRIGSAWTFWVFAIGFELAIVVGMLWLFRRRKWI